MRSAPTAKTDSVILVVLDGVRPHEIFLGVDPALARSSGLSPAEVVSAEDLTPTLHALMDRGVAIGAPGGARMRASGPHFVSLPGYTEIFTGRTPTRCPDNYCAGAGDPTIADEVGGRLSPEAVGVVASWELIERAATARNAGFIMSTGRHHGAHLDRLREDPALRALVNEGADASCAPGVDDFRPDRHTARLGLRFLALRRPRFLFLGLGEPDEYAHRSNYRGYLASLRNADDVLHDLVDALTLLGPEGKGYTLFITTDHGRSTSFRDHGGGYPESARTWLVASGGAVPARGILEDGEAHRLADIAPTIRALLGLAEDSSPNAGRAIASIVSP